VKRWVLIAFVALLVLLVIVAAVASRSETLRQLVVATLSDRLESQVELESFSVGAFPGVTIRGRKLVLRHRGRTDVPPLVQIESFTVECSILDLLRRPRRFKRVTLEGLVVNIPPGGLRGGLTPAKTSAPEDTSFLAAPIVVDTLLANGAVLRLIPRRDGKPPREFVVHALEMHSLGIASQMPFTAQLTNPVPTGLIQTSGTFGPWQKSDPGSTPLAGQFTFEKANLDTIDGIGGILSSSGQFTGRLERIEVSGETHTPDFHLDISAQPVSLDTKFDAVVDGTDGDTYLNAVDGTFLRTSLSAKGAVVGRRGLNGRTINLHVRITEGRIEDLLRLSVQSSTPLMIGRVALHTDFTLPPGHGDVIERLRLTGEFDVDAARFTDRGVQDKLSGMSARARGLDPDEKADNVVSDLNGRFRLASGVLHFADLAFGIPGATVQLQGSYGLRTEALAFEGELRMQATISQAAGGGVRSVFLKLVDPLFKRKGAGAVVPLRIGGTRAHPKYGVDIGRALKRK
jgi:uncharacterized protein involved in outer membrane biogenesis